VIAPSISNEESKPAKKEKRGRELVYKPKTPMTAVSNPLQASDSAPLSQPAASDSAKLLESQPIEEKKERLRSKSRPKQERPQLIYKRKDEVTAEDRAVKIDDSAKPADGAENTKGRRRDGQSSRRDATAKDIPRYKSRARGGDQEGEEQEEPKFTSAYDEFRAGFWRRPKKEKIKVTHETEIPAPPKPILEHPDEAAYHKSMADVDEKIDALIKKSVSFILKSDFIYRKTSGTASTRRSDS
jgi:hypothetical protein